MATNLFFNLAATSPSAALVRGVASNAPVGNKPEFVLGDNRDFNVYLTDGAGNYDSSSGAGGYTLKLAIGNPGATPTGGTYRIGVSSATSGTLTSGKIYYIQDYNSGDDFSNLSATNATGNIFTASGTTPTTWTNGSTLWEITTSLAYNASASDIQTAINATAAHASAVSVAGTFPNFRVAWSANGNKSALTAVSTALSPTSSVIVSTEQGGTTDLPEIQTIHIQRAPAAYQYTWGTITNGWNARLNTNTYAFRELLGTNTTANTTLELEVTDSGGNRYTHVQVPVVIRHEVIDESALTSTTLDNAISSTDAQNQYVQNRSSITGLTGGGATNLDGIATVSATVGWLVVVKLSDTTWSKYRLVTGTDAESSPNVIRPDDYAATTNEKVWKLQTLSTAGMFTTETISAFSSAGNDNVTLATNGLHHVAFATANAGAGAYTRTLSLVNTNATTGDVIDLRIDFAASTNPTVEVRNATSGGTLLTTIVGDGSTGTVHAFYQYTGSAWAEVGGYWV